MDCNDIFDKTRSTVPVAYIKKKFTSQGSFNTQSWHVSMWDYILQQGEEVLMGRLIGCKILSLNLGGFINFIDMIIENLFNQTSFF